MRNVNERIKYTNSVCQECKLKHRVLYSLKHYSLRLLGKTPTSDTVKQRTANKGLSAKLRRADVNGGKAADAYADSDVTNMLKDQ